MGKRKRRAHPPPIAPLSASVNLVRLHCMNDDSEPCSSGMNPLSTEEPPKHINTRTTQPHSSSKDIMGGQEEQNDQISISHHQHHHHHNNSGRSTHSKRSRNRGQHHPRHNQGYHYSTYHAKNNPSFDHKWTPELVFNTDGGERGFHKPERIRSKEIPMEVMPGEDDDNMVCGTCERLLRQKQPPGSGLINSEPSVVAVLVCGHFFHADCLEMRTKAEDASDPRCPLCLKL